MARLPRRASSSEEYAGRRLALRDYLAVERTRLANERTVLAYLRTTLALLAGSITLLNLFDTPTARITGWLLLPVAFVIFAFGTARYVAVRRGVRDYAERYVEAPEAPASDAPPTREGG